MNKRFFLGISVLLIVFTASSCKKKEYNMFADLYGIVTDFDSNDQISGATVTLSPGGKTQVTGADGRFEFLDLDPQQYTITVQKAGYQTNRKTITAVIGEKTEANIQLTQSN